MSRVRLSDLAREVDVDLYTLFTATCRTGLGAAIDDDLTVSENFRSAYLQVNGDRLPKARRRAS